MDRKILVVGAVLLSCAQAFLPPRPRGVGGQSCGGGCAGLTGSRAAASAAPGWSRGLHLASTASLSDTAAPAPNDLLGDGGVLKTRKAESDGEPLTDGSVVVVRYRGLVAGAPGAPGAAQPVVFTASEGEVFTVGDGTMIPGWDTALRSMKVGEAAAFTVAPQYGYGAGGVAPVIPPNTSLDFQVEVLSLKGNILTDATFADSAPLTPRTPSAIKAEFERRQAEKVEAKEGLEGVLEWVKSIYIFGFFDAPKGGQLPWYLRPIITFPVMFAIVGAAFAVVITAGGVSMERDAFTLDNDMVSSLFLDQTQRLLLLDHIGGGGGGGLSA